MALGPNWMWTELIFPMWSGWIGANWKIFSGPCALCECGMFLNSALFDGRSLFPTPPTRSYQKQTQSYYRGREWVLEWRIVTTQSTRTGATAAAAVTLSTINENLTIEINYETFLWKLTTQLNSIRTRVFVAYNLQQQGTVLKWVQII